MSLMEGTEGKTLVMVEHDMNIVFDIADRIRCWSMAKSLPVILRRRSEQTPKCRRPISERRHWQTRGNNA